MLLTKYDLQNKSNLKAGFRACGIHPFNPSAVLKKLPKQPGDCNNNNAVLQDTLVEYLRSSRYENGSKVIKRRKLNIQAGKSVAFEDLARVHKSTLVSTDSVTIETAATCDTSNSAETSHSSSNVIDLDRPKLGETSVSDFLLVKLKQGNMCKTYVAVVNKCYGNWEFEVTFLKQSPVSGYFVYLENDEKFDIAYPDIVRKLSNPIKQRRGELQFAGLKLD